MKRFISFQSHARLRIILRLLFFIIITAWFSLWALNISMDLNSPSSGPDELMRYMIPSYIYEHNSIPSGYDEGAVYSVGYWSYAFYPQLLGAIVSSLFMFLMGVIRDTPYAILFAARMGSVLFGVLAVYMVGKSVTELLKNNRHASFYAYIAMVLLAAWPQFAFLSGYVNNDIVAIAGASVLLYACIRAYRRSGWDITGAIIFLAGITLCLLGYANSYGFVLFMGLYFMITLLIFGKADRRQALKMIGIVLAGALILITPFFARNAIIYKGDIFGMTTFKAQTAKWEKETGDDLQHTYTEISGRNTFEIIRDSKYINQQVDSSISVFGYMSIVPENQYTLVYRAYFILSLCGAMWYVVSTKLLKRNKRAIYLILAVLLSILTTIALSLYYSIAIDYQAQGRYILYILIPQSVFGIFAISFMADKILKANYQKRVLLVLLAVYLTNTTLLFNKYIL